MKNIPINKGNYDMETEERLSRFEEYRAEGWEEEYHDYRRNWTKYAKEQFVAEWPVLVDIELSSVCNLHCPMCYTITDKFKEKVNATLMQENLFKKIVDEIAGNVVAVRLSLRGEATIHPKFIEFIKYAKEKGIKEVSFLTNGSRLEDDFIKELILAGADWVTVSVDGLDKMYESIRWPLKFEDTFRKIRRFSEIKREYGVHRPVVKIQGIWPSVRDDVELFYNTFEPYTDLIAFNPLIDYLDNDEEIVYEEDFSCPQLYQRIIVAADGQVLMCSNDEDNMQVIGDLNKETIHGIWHGEKLTKMRNLHKEKDGFKNIDVCKKCYLPRATEDSERAIVNGREIIIKNYIGRSQKIGE